MHRHWTSLLKNTSWSNSTNATKVSKRFGIGFPHGGNTIMKSVASFSDSSSGHGRRDELDKTDHLTRTSSDTRQDDIHSMAVTDLVSLSPTVKGVVLKTEQTPPRISFKAGQWVDAFLPGVDTVGGFSMSSSPQELSTKGILRLAVKFSTHPPAKWMHESCKIGDILKVRIGGDFYLSSDHLHTGSKVLLIAGGVGINPLSSIVHFMQEGKKQGTIDSDTRLYLLFSAKEECELLFKDEFQEYRLSDKTFNATYFVTGKSSSPSGDARIPKNLLQYRRMGPSDLLHACRWLQQSNDANDTSEIETFLCGPPPMIKCMTDALTVLNFKKPHFEQWW